jgi:hypothetical protein
MPGLPRLLIDDDGAEPGIVGRCCARVAGEFPVVVSGAELNAANSCGASCAT